LCQSFAGIDKCIQPTSSMIDESNCYDDTDENFFCGCVQEYYAEAEGSFSSK